MNILVINSGSSSVKYQLINMDDKSVIAKGVCERIGIDGVLTYSSMGKPKVSQEVEMNTHADGIKILIKKLLSPEEGCISSMDEIEAVGHRIVHGGDYFTQPVIVDEKVMELMEKCVDLAPLHGVPEIAGVKACKKLMGDTKQVLVFDTAFHQTMPEKAFLYAIPYEYYEKFKIRKYGFHGTSHKYVSTRAAQIIGRPLTDLKIVSCHLGNGSSITAVNAGKSVDTSMGFTPLDGLMMGTRCGSIDPAIVPYLMDKENLSAGEINDIMNKDSGLIAMSGISSDMRDITAAAEEGNKRAQIAVDMLAYQIKKFIGAYAAAMNGLDAVIFTAGIGENHSQFRFKAISGLDFLGIKVDEEKNRVSGVEREISTPDSKVRVLAIPTNEELMIAMETEKLVSGN